MDFATKAIHIGQEPDPATGATIVPIYQTSTYTQRAPGEHLGFDYSRTINPTRLALERCLASLENASYGLCFASGMAATTAALVCTNVTEVLGGPHGNVSVAATAVTGPTTSWRMPTLTACSQTSGPSGRAMLARPSRSPSRSASSLPSRAREASTTGASGAIAPIARP